VRRIVSKEHVKCKEIRISLDDLPAENRIFVIAATLSHHDQNTTFTAKKALDIYNNYALTHSPIAPLDSIANVMETLVGNNLLRLVKDNQIMANKEYQLKISNEEIQALANVTSRQKDELERFFALCGLTQDC